MYVPLQVAMHISGAPKWNAGNDKTETKCPLRCSLQTLPCFAAYCLFLNNAQINFSTMEIINTGSKPGVSSRAQIKSCRNPTAGACLIISLFFDVLFRQVS